MGDLSTKMTMTQFADYKKAKEEGNKEAMDLLWNMGENQSYQTGDAFIIDTVVADEELPKPKRTRKPAAKKEDA